MKKIYTYFIVCLLILVVAGVWIFRTERARVHDLKNVNAKLVSFAVSHPFFEAMGVDLSRVEIWGVPLDATVSEGQYIKLGDASLKTVSVSEQVWQFKIPVEPKLLSEVFARGYNEDNKKVSQISLAERGMAAIGPVLWPGLLTDVVLKIGEQKEALGLSVKLISVDADSRCPLGVMCIRAGDVKMTLSLSALGTSTDVVISTESGIRFAGYAVAVKEVVPAKKQGMINRDEYGVTFTISFNK
jgi:hypothetical protein